MPPFEGVLRSSTGGPVYSIVKLIYISTTLLKGLAPSLAQRCILMQGIEEREQSLTGVRPVSLAATTGVSVDRFSSRY